MPELPDLAVLAEAFDAALVGRPLASTTVAESLVVRGTPAELEALRGQRLGSVARRGKFLVFQFERDRVVANPMLTGRLGLASGTEKAWRGTAVVLELGPAAERPPSSAEPAGWTRGASWLPAEDRPVQLRYRDPTRMGKIYVVPSGVERPVAGWLEQGPDADDPALDLATWRSRIARHRGELKGVLRNQAFIAGVGNAYSDEILWAAALAPFRKRTTLAPEEIDELYRATRSVLARAIEELRSSVPPRFEVEVRDFLAVHGKGGQACPRCGTRLTELSPGGFVTTFCRGCQR